MRHFLSGQLHWMALGVGILVLAGGISVSLWLSERDDGPAPALGAGETAPGQLQTGVDVPSLPARSTADGGVSGGVSSPAYDAGMSDSVELDAGPTGSGLIAANNAAASDTAELDAVGSDPELTAANGATVSDSAELEVQQTQAPPPRGGPGDVGSIGDSADLVVRDASGNIKQRKTVK